MAFFQCNFFSHALQISTSLNVILPQPGPWTEGGAERKWPALYLLHGLSDDHTIWQRRTSIERYVEQMPLAVVMPAVNRSFYTDMVHGAAYWTFVSEELPALARSFFPLSSAREDTFVAGLSMGGFGAFKLALNYPERYAAAASLSGAVDILSDRTREPAWKHELQMMFGSLSAARGGTNDLFALADALVHSERSRPQLYQWCGTEDFLYQSNVRFHRHTKKLGLAVTYEEGPGTHEWGYWDAIIQRVLAWLPLGK